MMMMMVILLVLGAAVPLISCDSIIMNEDALIGTCTRTCDNMPVVYDKNGCSRIHSCRRNSKGWNRGFVRCDYCQCQCVPKVSNRRERVTRRDKGFTEPQLYGTCTRTCSKSGLVRNNFGGCTEVRDCHRDRKGWTRGFVRCDYCTCVCVVKTFTSKYRLTNVRYDLSRTSEETDATLRRVGHTVVENRGNQVQTVTRSLSFTLESSSSISTSQSLEVGISVTVEAGVSIGVASLSSSVTTSINAGFTFKKGRTETKTEQDSIAAQITVPKKSSVEALVVGHRMKVNIPYTATLVTEYENGTEKRERITGVYTNASVGKFRVQYQPARRLP